MSRSARAKQFRLGKRQTSLTAALRLNHRIKTGELKLESAPCFCGSDESVKVGEYDRNGITVPAVICTQCALVRLEPRPTQVEYGRFYRNEYRDLNNPKHTGTLVDSEEENTALYRVQLKKGISLQSLMADHAIEKPEVVVDYGCHFGGMMMPFHENGAECWGIELNEEHAAVVRQDGMNCVGFIDELIDKGVKADFVIMQDMIEHLVDLCELLKLREIMVPNKSTLYIWTPGLFRVQFPGNYQFAHTYYFCANTLHFVLTCLGFDVHYVDEECRAFATVNPTLPSAVRKPTEWVEFCLDEVQGKEQRKLPPFSGVCKFTKKELFDNIEKNLSYKRPDIIELSGSESGDVVIISGGPSIDSQIDEIKRLVSEGAKVISVARMYPWCAEHGIKPDYVVSLDCSEDQEKGFTRLQSGTKHLLSTVTRPSIFEILKDQEIYIFDSRSEMKCRDLRQAAGYKSGTVINGGGSVSVLAISIAFNLGFRRLHIFGFDSMVSSKEQTHATGISGTSLTPMYMSCTIDGEEILTTQQWIEFTRQALDLISVAHDEKLLDFVKFYGESLINKMWNGVWEEEPSDV